MTLTLGHYLSLGAMLFALAVIGIFLNRKNLIVLLMHKNFKILLPMTKLLVVLEYPLMIAVWL